MGCLGRIVSTSVVLRWCRDDAYYADAWHGRWALDGGVLAQQGIHHLDAVRYLNGPIASVAGTYDQRINKLEAEDTIVGFMKFDNGALGTFELTTACRPADIEASITILGTAGFIRLGGIALNKIDDFYLVKNGEIVRDASALDVNEEVETGYGYSHGRQFEMIYDEVADGVSGVTFSSEDVAETLASLHAIYASCESHEYQSVAERVRSKKLGVLNGQQ